MKKPRYAVQRRAAIPYTSTPPARPSDLWRDVLESIIVTPVQRGSHPSAPRAPRLQLDDEIAVECIRNSHQRVDPGRPAAGLQTRDRRLCRAGQLRELALREPERLTPLGHLLRDRREEPAAILHLGDPLAQAFERCLPRSAHEGLPSDSTVRPRRPAGNRAFPGIRSGPAPMSSGRILR